MECVLGALAQLLPDRVPADGEGGNSIISIGGITSAGQRFGYVDLIAGARGAGPAGDGAEGVPHPGANISSTSIEIAESELPRIEEYEMVAGSGGAGRHRGALAQRRTVRLLDGKATLQLRSDKRNHRPYGLQGGADGAPSSNILRRADGSTVALPTLAVAPMRAGDVIEHTFASGAGWGDPLTRPPALVLEDVWTLPPPHRSGQADAAALRPRVAERHLR
jgi:N-methylhydantoinase B